MTQTSTAALRQELLGIRERVKSVLALQEAISVDRPDLAKLVRLPGRVEQLRVVRLEVRLEPLGRIGRGRIHLEEEDGEIQDPPAAKLNECAFQVVPGAEGAEGDNDEQLLLP
jgi:hypothetical protein